MCKRVLHNCYFWHLQPCKRPTASHTHLFLPKKAKGEMSENLNIKKLADMFLLYAAPAINATSAPRSETNRMFQQTGDDSVSQMEKAYQTSQISNGPCLTWHLPTGSQKKLTLNLKSLDNYHARPLLRKYCDLLLQTQFIAYLKKDCRVPYRRLLHHLPWNSL